MSVLGATPRVTSSGSGSGAGGSGSGAGGSGSGAGGSGSGAGGSGSGAGSSSTASLDDQERLPTVKLELVQVSEQVTLLTMDGSDRGLLVMARATLLF